MNIKRVYHGKLLKKEEKKKKRQQNPVLILSYDSEHKQFTKLIINTKGTTKKFSPFADHERSRGVLDTGTGILLMNLRLIKDIVWSAPCTSHLISPFRYPIRDGLAQGQSGILNSDPRQPNSKITSMVWARGSNSGPPVFKKYTLLSTMPCHPQKQFKEKTV